MEGELQLGVSKTNISPVHPVQLAGFSSRRGLGAYEGITRPIYARTFFFTSVDQGEAAASAVVVSADLLWWGSDRVGALKRKIRERWGVAENAILLHGTHTHSGPQTSERFTTYLGECDPEYLADMEERLLQGIEKAAGNLEAVTAEKGTGQFGLGINRRNIAKTPPDPEPVDRELTVIRYRTANGGTKGLLVHYACHPVITNENRLSSEFPGVAMEELENGLGGDAVSAFLQGTCGDINASREGRVWRGKDEDVVKAGLGLAAAVTDVLEGSMRPLPYRPLQADAIVVPLPLQPLPTAEYLDGLAGEAGVLGEWSRRMKAALDQLEPFLELKVARLRLAGGLSLLAMNAEVVVEYGLFVKRLSAGETLPIGYTNGMFGYIPTARQIEEGGYEPMESTRYFAMPAPFSTDVETVLKQSITEFLKEQNALDQAASDFI